MTNHEDPTKPESDDITTEEVIQNLEFCLWTAVVLIPILYYINGASVSNDQWYMRAGLVAVAYVGAPLMTWIRRKRCRAAGNAVTEANHTADKSTGSHSTAVEE